MKIPTIITPLIARANIKIFIGLILCFLQFIATAQNDPLHQLISRKDGLPSDEVYFTYEDTLGIMWIGTDRGLVRYDGLNLQVLTTEDGLPGDVILNYTIDPRGRMWFITYKSGLFYFDQGVLIIPPFNEDLLDLTEKIEPVHALYIDSLDNIIFSIEGGAQYYYKTHLFDSIIYCEAVSSSTNFISGLYHITHKKKIVVDIKSFVYFKIPCLNPHANKIKNLKINLALKQFYIKGNRSTYGFDKKYKQIFYFRNYIYSYNSKGEIDTLYQLPNDIISILKTAEALYVGTYQGGLYKFKTIKSELRQEWHYFKERSVSNIQITENGHLWISTLTGLIHVPSTNAFKCQLPDSFDIYYIDNELLFKGDSILVLSKNIIYIFRNDLEKGNIEYLGQIEGDKNYFGTAFESAAWSYDKKSIFFKSFEWDYHTPEFEDAITSQFDTTNWKTVRKIAFNPSGDTSLYLLGRGFLSVYDGKAIFYSGEVGFTKEAVAIKLIGPNIFLVGTYNGLYKISEKEAIFLGEKNEIFKNRISDIKSDDHGRLYVVTQGAGLIIIDGRDTLYINENAGLSSNYCSRALVDGNNIYLATLKGLNQIITNDTGIVLIRNFPFNKELEYSGIDHLYKLGDTLIIQSGKTLIYFEPENYFLSERPKIKLINFEADGADVPKNKNNKYQLKHTEDALTVSFRTRNFQIHNEVLYKYRLANLNNSWTTNTSGTINFQNLASGNYRLEVKTRNNAGIWSDPLSINFEIIPPWYQRWWFTLIWVGALLLMIIGIARWRYKRLETNRKLLTYNIRALSLQINPHFVFNALNSVQYFIATNQKREANLFLAKISTLIRGVLSNADSNTISLALELKRLEDYIELEKMRLTDQFNYTLEVDKAIDPEKINIMPLLIQPSVENAIWHGLSGIKYPGKLVVKVYLKEKDLIVEVSDNGPGIPQQVIDAIYEGKVRGSIGLQNTMARVRAMSKIKDREHKMTIENIKDTNNINSTGTVITLILPL